LKMHAVGMEIEHVARCRNTLDESYLLLHHGMTSFLPELHVPSTNGVQLSCRRPQQMGNSRISCVYHNGHNYRFWFPGNAVPPATQSHYNTTSSYLFRAVVFMRLSRRSVLNKKSMSELEN
jgi:hypothetical protein